MRSRELYASSAGARVILMFVAVWTTSGAGAAMARPYVEFDFARIAECRDVTDEELCDAPTGQRLILLTLPVSVRFHGVTAADVHELDIEINGAAAGLRVYDFWPSTQLHSDIAQSIETTMTTKRDRSLEATLGGKLPVPFAEQVAHVTPSATAAMSSSRVATEKMSRLPPKQAVVVSGTSSEGRGVFFKLKRSSQTSLEGVHELAVIFVAPAGWQAGVVEVGGSARGRREVFWIKQSATLGRAAGTVQIHLAGGEEARILAEKRHERARAANRRRPSLFQAAAAEMINVVNLQPFDRETSASEQTGEPKASPGS